MTTPPEPVPPVPARLSYWPVPDPAGAPPDQVRRIADDLERSVAGLVQSLLPEPAAARGGTA